MATVPRTAIPLVPAQWVLVITLMVAGITVAAWQLLVGAANDWFGHGGADYSLYVDVTRRWLSGGPFYQSWQVAGPYSVSQPYGAVLYPPVALWLFGPFTVLPAVLWWLIPLAAVAWAVWRHSPDPRVWPLLALCIAWPPSIVKLVTGNPVIWAMAAVAVGSVYAWPAVFALIKPSLLPFALIGVRRRSWWVALGVLAVACVPFGGMWLAWIQTVLNAHDGGLLYSIQEVPLLALPLLAWAARRRSQATAMGEDRPPEPS